ncbi:MAG: hypothetical protein U1E17_01455 [Geminicoccaceae bacterium]
MKDERPHHDDGGDEGGERAYRDVERQRTVDLGWAIFHEVEQPRPQHGGDREEEGELAARRFSPITSPPMMVALARETPGISGDGLAEADRQRPAQRHLGRIVVARPVDGALDQQDDGYCPRPAPSPRPRARTAPAS